MKKLSVFVVVGLAISVVALSSCQRRVRTPKQVAEEKAQADAAKKLEEEQPAEQPTDTTPAPAPLSKEAFDADNSALAEIHAKLAQDAKNGEAFIIVDKSNEGVYAYSFNEAGLAALIKSMTEESNGDNADQYVADRLKEIRTARENFVAQYENKTVDGVEPDAVAAEVAKAKAMLEAIESICKALDQNHKTDIYSKVYGSAEPQN